MPPSCVYLYAASQRLSRPSSLYRIDDDGHLE
jgi:hypothetical protein